MTWKALKEFASQVHDDSVIEVREKSYRSWEREFEMQAPYVYKIPTIKAIDEVSGEEAVAH
jgi:hypothetical protein